VNTLKKRRLGFFRSESGQSLAEYGLILALVAIVAISGLTMLGNGLINKLTGIASSITASTAGGSCTGSGCSNSSSANW